jgi:diguanylate cyclase (GGDEF)-like protein
VTPPDGLRIPAQPDPPGEGADVRTSKRALMVLSHAVERAFDAVPDEDGPPGLVLAYFQLRSHFDVERRRYAALAAAGHVVVVVFAGPTDGMPEGVHCVGVPDEDERARDWVLVTVREWCATALVCTDAHALATSELTLEASRSFRAAWTFRRAAALSCARTQLGRLAAELDPQVMRSALACIAASEARPVLQGEAQLAAAAEHLMTSVDRGQRRATRLRLELQDSRSRAERDQLTGLYNRHFLERFLGEEDRPADLLLLLVDMDGLKGINDRHGHAGGDAALQAVARTLVASSRPGDVCVRWGGDEFLLLAPFTTPAVGLAFAERLVQAVSYTVPGPPWHALELSVSIGVCPSQRTTLPLAKLDEALQAVKRTGKGRAVLAAG